MEIRDIVVLLGLIAIVAIVWDGLRRMKGKAVVPRKRQEQEQEPYIDPEEAARRAQVARELPNGGARVRSMTDTEKNDLQSRLNLRERVPMLMERVQVAGEDETEDAGDADSESVQAELNFTVEPDSDVSFAEADEAGDNGELSFSATDDSETEPDGGAFAEPDPESSDAVFTDTTGQADDESPADDWTAPESGPAAAAAGGASQSEPAEAAEAELGPVEDLVVVHVMARGDEEFSGSSVLDLLLTAGLRHGPMEIFHYRNPQGVTEFSLANCIQPGTFDPDAMNQVNTPGVTLFMQLPNGGDAMEAFDHLYEMARFLAQHLDGDILDEDHSTVTPQRIEYYREKIRSFERSRLLPS